MDKIEIFLASLAFIFIVLIWFSDIAIGYKIFLSLINVATILINIRDVFHAVRETEDKK